MAAFRNLMISGILVLFAGFGPAAAAALETGGRAAMSEVNDGGTLVLDDGTTVRLVGIHAPKLPLGRMEFETQPLAEEAHRLPENLTQGRRVRVRGWLESHNGPMIEATHPEQIEVLDE